MQPGALLPAKRRKRRRKSQSNPTKKPAVWFHPEANKTPVADTPPRDHMACCARWRFQLVQMDGPWCWAGIDSEKVSEILAKLCDLEKLTWHDIFIQRSYHNHSSDVANLVKEARQRLKRLKLDDQDVLRSLRLSGKERVWGVLMEDVFYLLWWDPEHEVYPSQKRRT